MFRNIILHVPCYLGVFFQIKKKSYLKFDVSKHYEGNKTTIKRLVTEKITQHKTAEDKKYDSAVISVIRLIELCGYVGK